MVPNIVFAFADDWGRYASAYQKHEGPQSLSALIDTPHFDRVAFEGALFINIVGAGFGAILVLVERVTKHRALLRSTEKDD